MFKIRFKFLRFWLAAVLTVLLQASVIQGLSIGGAVPQLPLLSVIFFALYQGPERGMAAGLIIGGLTDLLSAGIMGINACVLGSIGAAAGCLRERVYTTHPLTRLLVAAAAATAHQLLYYFLAINFHRLPAWPDAAGLIGMSVVYTALANLAIAPLGERIAVEKVFTLT